MTGRNRIIACLTLLLLWTLIFPTLSADACATCGCSECCALGMMQEDSEVNRTSSLLSESVWGNMILRMAYKRDERLQKLSKKLGTGYDLANLTIFGIAGGTLAQNIISQATLNPPPPQFDSYLPGSLGLGMSSLLTVNFGAISLWRFAIQRKVRVRQLEIIKVVESVLQHMEYSETECPEAQKQLAELIGDRAARECEKLWRTSHVMASLPGTELEPPSGGTTIGVIPSVSVPDTTVSVRSQTVSLAQ